MLRREGYELSVSAVYNVLFWTFFVPGIVLLTSCRRMPDDLPLLAAGIVCLCLGKRKGYKIYYD